MATERVLYSFRRCPYAMRARMGLAISETPYVLREVLWARKPEAMLEASRKGTVVLALASLLTSKCWLARLATRG